MNYNMKNHSQDNLNQFFTKASDFNVLSKNLLEASSFNTFELWFEKLYSIDRRMTFFFLCSHCNEIDSTYIDRAQHHFKKKICKENAIDN